MIQPKQALLIKGTNFIISSQLKTKLFSNRDGSLSSIRMFKRFDPSNPKYMHHQESEGIQSKLLQFLLRLSTKCAQILGDSQAGSWCKNTP
jgi:hypothetical protein